MTLALYASSAAFDALLKLLPAELNAAEYAALAGPSTPSSVALAFCSALLRVVATLDVDREQLAHVRFFDEGYELAQATLAAWDVLGKDGFARVREVVRELDAIDAGATRREESE